MTVRHADRNAVIDDVRGEVSPAESEVSAKRQMVGQVVGDSRLDPGNALDIRTTAAGIDILREAVNRPMRNSQAPPKREGSGAPAVIGPGAAAEAAAAGAATAATSPALFEGAGL